MDKQILDLIKRRDETLAQYQILNQELVAKLLLGYRALHGDQVAPRSITPTTHPDTIAGLIPAATTKPSVLQSQPLPPPFEHWTLAMVILQSGTRGIRILDQQMCVVDVKVKGILRDIIEKLELDVDLKQPGSDEYRTTYELGRLVLRAIAARNHASKK